MGNTASENLVIELYKWSSADFPQEYALIYTSKIDESMFAIFRISAKPNKVLLRLADCVHDVRLDMEIIAERDNNNSNNINNNGPFKCRVARVFEAGTRRAQIPFTNTVVFMDTTATCGYNVKRRGGNANKMMIWEVWYSCDVSDRTRHKFQVNIECDKVTGLSVKLKGPFKIYSLVPDGLLGLQGSGSVIQREVNGEPPKHFNAFVERKFTGKEHVLFQQARWYSDTHESEQGVKVAVNNSGGRFLGNGNASRYENCNIVMQYVSDKGTN